MNFSFAKYVFLLFIISIIPSMKAESGMLSENENGILQVIAEANRINKSLLESFDSDYTMSIITITDNLDSTKEVVTKKGRFAYSGNKVLGKEELIEDKIVYHYVKNGNKAIIKPSDGLIAIGSSEHPDLKPPTPDPWDVVDCGVSLFLDNLDPQKYGKVISVEQVAFREKPHVKVTLSSPLPLPGGGEHDSTVQIWYSQEEGYLPKKILRITTGNQPDIPDSFIKGEVTKMNQYDIDGNTIYLPVSYIEDAKWNGNKSIVCETKYVINEKSIRLNPDLPEELFHIKILPTDMVMNKDLEMEIQGPGGRMYLPDLDEMNFNNIGSQDTEIARTKNISLCDNTNIELVYIPKGSCMIGSPETEIGYHPGVVNKLKKMGESTHKINEPLPYLYTVEKGFYFGKYPVTIDQFRCFMKENPSIIILPDNAGYSDFYPVTVTWEQASSFCEWLSKKTSLKVRLPKEEEWEYACRSSATTRFFWGEDESLAGKYANIADKSYEKKHPNCFHFDCDDGFSELAPVGQFLPNGFGLYDMIGNVNEWCSDIYKENPKDQEDIKMQSITRVFRGGDFMSDPSIARCASRSSAKPDDTNICSIGFRIVVEK